ncbi:MAG: DUF2179 domain-containing protein [Candidatus Cyclobacteriaceae bacterium M3_2C_046]
MESILDQLGISNEVFNYIVLPLLIFMARIGDVSIATIRIIFVLTGRKYLAPVFGFFESLIWLIAIGQIIQNIDNVYSYIAYASGFAAGTLIGMLIEEKLALGSVVIRVITRKESTELVEFFREKNWHYSILKAEGKDGKITILFSVIKREQLKQVLDAIKFYNPRAFYTVEGVKMVSEEGMATARSRYYGFKLFNLKRR